MEQSLTQAIADYIDQRKQTKLEPLQKALNKVLEKTENAELIAKAKSEYREKAEPIEVQFEPETWLTDAAKRAKQISLATHASKFAHSDAKASSMLILDDTDETQSYLVTASLKEKAIDAVGNAAALDVAKLLRVSVNGENLTDQLGNGHIEALRSFAKNDELLSQWEDGLRLALGDEKLAAHTLSKQLYFPVESGYHLLCPLFSSSLAHELYQSVNQTRFGDSKTIGDARKSGVYVQHLDQSYPKTAVQLFGGSKPQNISQLNSERYGQAYLLNVAPPVYAYKVKPPTDIKRFFNRRLSYQLRYPLREFKTFLVGLNDADKNFKTRYKRDYQFLQPVIDNVFDAVVRIQTEVDCPGWSTDKDVSLNPEYCYWLDIDNPDKRFQQARSAGVWMDKIASDFSLWLSKQLKSDKYLLSDTEQNYFKKVFLNQLKAFERHIPKLEVSA
jgi:CRISPR-associated protein, Csy1 family